ncbi:thioesterase II family protein [Streptomyces sp. NPDC089424]|uniref:thioesterase II family protein n=1 Tax=Streptomyces sp. NPDC089424 TaxID=3365917 RepID=UPI003822CD62
MRCTGSSPGGPQDPGTGGDVRLFGCPQAGGRSLAYRERPERFPSGRRVRAPDAPGRGAVVITPVFIEGGTRVAYFPGLLAPEIAGGRTPFAFFGHGTGSPVAYGPARRLQAEGPAPPVWLGISAAGTPRQGDAKAEAPSPDGALSGVTLRHSPGGIPALVLAHPRPWTSFTPAIRAGFAVPRGLRGSAAAAPLPVAFFAVAGSGDRAAACARCTPRAGRTGHLGLYVVPGGRILGPCVVPGGRILGPCVVPGGCFSFPDGLGAPAARVTAGVRSAPRSRLAGARRPGRVASSGSWARWRCISRAPARQSYRPGPGSGSCRRR